MGSGFVADRIGGLPTLLLGSIGQVLALLLYLACSGLGSLYAVSALVEGGIVPSYAIVTREYLPAPEAGMRFGVAIMATLLAMAFGGWFSGVIFGVTGPYRAAFANGELWNLLNTCIALTLLTRVFSPRRSALPVVADH